MAGVQKSISNPDFFLLLIPALVIGTNWCVWTKRSSWCSRTSCKCKTNDNICQCRSWI